MSKMARKAPRGRGLKVRGRKTKGGSLAAVPEARLAAVF